MPRITEQRRDAKRAEIVAAARRCFARDGFHRTSMPDIAAEAGVSVGAPYRYFTGKEELILEIAGQAFRAVFAPVEALVAGRSAISVPDLVAACVAAVDADETTDITGAPVPVVELLRCAVQAWSELLRDPQLREGANAGFDVLRGHLEQALRRGQAARTVPLELDPEQGSRVLIALLHGIVLQRVAFGLDDSAGIADGWRLLVTPGSVAPRFGG